MGYFECECGHRAESPMKLCEHMNKFGHSPEGDD